MNTLWLCMYSSISAILSVVRDCDPFGARDLGHAFRQDLGAGEGSAVRIALRVKNIFLGNSSFVTGLFFGFYHMVQQHPLSEPQSVGEELWRADGGLEKRSKNIFSQFSFAK